MKAGEHHYWQKNKLEFFKLHLIKVTEFLGEVSGGGETKQERFAVFPDYCRKLQQIIHLCIFAAYNFISDIFFVCQFCYVL